MTETTKAKRKVRTPKERAEIIASRIVRDLQGLATLKLSAAQVEALEKTIEREAGRAFERMLEGSKPTASIVLPD